MSSSLRTRVSDYGQRRMPFDVDSVGLAGLLLVAPGAVLFLSFMLFPIAFLIYLSFTDATHAGTVLGGEASLIGLDNYAELFTDPQFWQSFGVTWLFLAVSLAIKVVLATGIAMILTHARVLGKRYMRALVIVPMGFPAIFVITIWEGMFSGARYGPLNQFAGTYNSIVSGFVGVLDSLLFFVTVSAPELLLADVPIQWLSGRWSAFFAYVITEVWLAYPFMVIIIVSALQDVPMDLHDAAKVDGAGYLRRFTNVTLPAVKRPVLFASILTAATSFQQFLIPFIFNRGGPSRQNELLILYGYREAIDLNEYAFASAIMVTAIAFIGMFMWLAVKKGNLAEGIDSA